MTKTARVYGGSLYDLAAEEKLDGQIMEQMIAIRPASIHCQLFSVIQKIIRQFVHYANKISEKDQSGKCRM